MHIVESLVYTAKVLTMRDELVNLELAILVVGDEIGELSAAFDTTEGAAFPASAGDELESWEMELAGVWENVCGE